MIRKLVLVVCILVGMLVGILLQQYHLPGKVLWQIRSSFDTQTVSHSQAINLEIRDLENNQYVYYTNEIELSRLALILIDVWQDSPSENLHAKLLPLVEAAREHQLLIIHSPSNGQVHQLIGILPGEVVLADGPEGQAQLDNLLEKKNIEYLLYAGYYSNMCILNRPTGIVTMAYRGYRNRIIFVRDASTAAGTPSSIEVDSIHKVIISLVELDWGATTTVDDVVAALEGL